jgi:5-formyltetrahydrofolate cyclo-ligase
MNQLKQNQWGIDEPEFGEEIYPEEFDLIIVPLLAFDKSGHRVGYGKGYYDRFLSKCRPDAKRIGLSFFKPTDNIDAEEHDLQLTSVITTAEIFTF